MHSRDRPHRSLSQAEEGILNQIFGGATSSTRTTMPSTRLNTPMPAASPRPERTVRSKLPPSPKQHQSYTFQKYTKDLAASSQSCESISDLITSISTATPKHVSQTVVGELQASPRTLEQAAFEQTEFFSGIAKSILQELYDIKARVAKVEEDLDAMGV